MPRTCTYVNTLPTLVLMCRSQRTPFTACSVSTLIEVGLQSLWIRGNPCWLPYIIQINLTMPRLEPQMICLVEQLRHNIHMYSMWLVFSGILTQIYMHLIKTDPCPSFYTRLTSAFAVHPKPRIVPSCMRDFLKGTGCQSVCCCNNLF